MRKEFQGKFVWKPNFDNGRNCGGSVQTFLEIASAVLSQEWRPRYLCTIKIKPRPATREVGNAYRTPSSAGVHTGLCMKNKTYAVCFAWAEWSLCHRLGRNGIRNIGLPFAIIGLKPSTKKLEDNRTSKQRNKKHSYRLFLSSILCIFAKK